MPEDAVSPVLLRMATASDVAGVMQVDRRVYPTPWSKRMTLHQILEPGRVHVVAENRGVVVGHGGVLFMADGAHVSTIAVDPAQRRRRIGSDVLLALFRASIAEGARAVTLEVRAANSAALALYRRFAMAPVGVRRGYYADTGEDALVLWSPELEGEYVERIAAMSYGSSTELGAEIEAWNPAEVPT